MQGAVEHRARAVVVMLAAGVVLFAPASSAGVRSDTRPGRPGSRCTVEDRGRTITVSDLSDGLRSEPVAEDGDEPCPHEPMPAVPVPPTVALGVTLASAAFGGRRAVRRTRARGLGSTR